MERGRDKFKRYKNIMNIAIRIFSLIPKRFRVKLFEHYRMTKGIKGIAIRYVILKTLAKSVGDNVSIHPNVYLYNTEEICIGNNVSIHPMCYIDGQGGLSIGDDVSIAHAVSILPFNHVHKDINVPIKDQGIVHEAIVIKSNVWIGAKASILSGVTLESGCIIATGAVVNKNVDPFCIVGGVPAKVLKCRAEEDL